MYLKLRSPSRARARRIAAAVVIAAALVPAVSGAASPVSLLSVTTVADSGAGSLRQALLDANASEGADVINFAIPGCAPTCVIRPSIALPVLTGGAITIDGFSQPGASPPTASGPAAIRVALDGADVENHNGLTIASPRNEVAGLAIYGFGWNGIAIAGPAAIQNIVWGNHIGVEASPYGAAPAIPNGFGGVFVGLGATQNKVGNNILTQRNVISGNTWEGVGIHGADTADNNVQGNYIGLSALGTTAVPNGIDGVRHYGGAGALNVGVVDIAEQRNVISGNARDGVRSIGEGTHLLKLDGNLIGTDPTGTIAIGNAGDGVHVLDGALGVAMGAGPRASVGLVSGNVGHGVHVEGGTLSIQRHIVGLDATGLGVLANHDGIRVVDAPGVVIGGGELLKGNVISGNRGSGIVLTGAATADGVVEGNRIGVNTVGTGSLGNAEDGVRIQDGAHDNRVGNPGTAGNGISGNGRSGIVIDNADNTAVRGNWIGTDLRGESPLGNASAGIYVRAGSAGTKIGGLGDGEGNLIAGNQVGISLQSDVADTLVARNRIGVGADESAAGLGNTTAGLRIEDGTTGTRSQGNVIAYNGAEGVLMYGEPTRDNRLLGERIHDNVGVGIRLSGGANGSIARPAITSYDPSTQTVAGTGCPDCDVEIYCDAADEGAHPMAVGTVSPAGMFAVTLPAPPDLAFLTAIVTDAGDGSSAFSYPYDAAAPTATASTSPTATASTSPTATATASVSATPTTTIEPSATPTRSASATHEPSPTGSPTGTATEAPSATPSVSAEPTTARTATVTPSVTRTMPVPSASVTASPRASSTATSPGGSPTGTVSATGTSAPSATTGPTPTPSTATPPAPGDRHIWLPYAARSGGGS